MGVLTDLVIANTDKAENVAHSIAPLNEWRGIDAKGHSQITLGTLLCILRGDDYGETVLEEFPLLAQASEDGAWVFAVPQDLVTALHQSDDAQIPTIVTEWLKSEEMQNANYNVENFLRDLKNLVTEAVSQQKSVLMWMCL